MSKPVSTRALARRRSRPRGQALVEFAIVLPVLIGVLGGIVDLGMMLRARVSLINAVREGARWAALQSNVRNIPTNASATGLTQPGGVIGTLSGLSWSTLDPGNGIQLSCSHDGVAYGVCDFVSGGLTDAVQGDSILVRATYDYNSFFTSLFGQPILMSAQDQMVLQVPKQ